MLLVGLADPPLEGGVSPVSTLLVGAHGLSRRPLVMTTLELQERVTTLARAAVVMQW